MRLRGKVAIVTGSGTGLGRAIAILFGREGASVVVNGRRPGPLKSSAGAIADAGGNAVAVPGDVTAASDVQRLIDTTIGAFGKLDILVNNAGAVISRTTVLECSEDDWRQTIDTNLTSAFLCSKYALPELIKSRGNIIHVSSIFALVGARSSAAYSASKGALLTLTRGMALDFAPHGVRVNALCPAYIETEMNRSLLAELRRRGEFPHVLERIPLGSLGNPEDVAYAAVYLASDEASWITGIALPVDGGMGASGA